jgi:hypothetical protein
LDEFAERARLAHDARTLDDLADVVSDLPAEAPAPEAPRRDLMLIFAIAAAALVLLGLFIAVSR